MNELLEMAVKAHGGMARWQQVKRIHLQLSITGFLFAVKGLPDGMSNILMSIDTGEQAVTMTPYARFDRRGRYTPSRVWIEDRAGALVEELNSPRQSFDGHNTLEDQWTQLQRLYFTAYAFWNYLTTPFLFTQPGFETQELSTHLENGQTWRRLRVQFPPNIAAHCREQTYYFNSDGLLQRVDYVTDVAGGVGSHYCFDHVDYDGIVIPTLRRVVPRTPNPEVFGSSAVLIQIANAIIE
jgi:hypothetical protein